MSTSSLAILAAAVLVALAASSCASLRDRVNYWTTPAPEYTVERANPKCLPDLSCDWESPAWDGVKGQSLTFVFHRSEFKKARITFRLLYDDNYIYGIFQGSDRFVTATHLRDDSMVCRDTCVEAFIMPSPKGFINTEMSIAGTRLFQLRPWDPQANEGKGGYPSKPFPPGIAEQCKVASSLTKLDTLKSRTINPEITGGLVWMVEFRIPIKAFETLMEKPGPIAGQTWRANFYHCAEYSSHRRWMAWAPVPILNFHTPQYFANITFAEK